MAWNVVALYRPQIPLQATAHQLIPLSQMKHLLTKKEKNLHGMLPSPAWGLKVLEKSLLGGDNFVGERSRNFELKIKIA